LSNFPKRAFISLITPATVTIVFPIACILPGDADRVTWLKAVPPAFGLAIPGIGKIIAGFVLLAVTFPLFPHLSQGAIMPWEPSTELIIKGLNCSVCNPMHIGLFLIMIGEGLTLCSPCLLLLQDLPYTRTLFTFGYPRNAASGAGSAKAAASARGMCPDGCPGRPLDSREWQGRGR
jgi:hypothetical protein